MCTFKIALAALMLTSLQAAHAQIRSEQNKVLWAGLENPLHIAEPGWEPGELGSVPKSVYSEVSFPSTLRRI